MSYVMAGQLSELERLRLQSRVWEPAGQALLQRIDMREVRRAIDIGCGAMGWLGALAGRMEPAGTIVGTDIDDKMLEAAGAVVEAQRCKQVQLPQDGLVATQPPPDLFDRTHGRFPIAPLGRADQPPGTYLARTRPGGLIVLEDPDTGSWHFKPPAAAAKRLIE